MVRAIDRTEKEVTIDFDEREVVYDFADLNEITLAWATSIHKSQGSEYPVVILPLIVGSEKAIAIAVKQVKQQQRYTKLEERLKRKN